MIRGFLKRLLLQGIRARGYELHVAKTVFSEHVKRAQLACKNGTLLDIGGNRGDYAAQAIEAGFTGRIVIVEPLPDLCAGVRERFAQHPQVTVHCCAIESTCGQGTVFRGAADATSSLLEPTKTFLENTPQAKTIEEVPVDTRTLDSLTATLPTPFFLKIDVQGAELDVLAGAERTLADVRFLQIEASLRPIYKSAPDLLDLLSALTKANQTVVNICAGYWLRLEDALGQVELLCEPSSTSK